MQELKVEPGSNKQFGLFFSSLFMIAAVYFYINNALNAVYCFATAALVLSVITLINADILLPLNKLWSSLGMILGRIMNPIIMGVIFFGIFTPMALFMRLVGRDELKLRFTEQNTYWIKRDPNAELTSFKDQF